MNHKLNIAKRALYTLSIGLVFAACQKMERPALGDYPKDANPPGGPLKFYTAFDGTTDNPLMNAVDSIRANFPSDNPLSSIAGISGAAVQGVDQKAILYPSANDFASVTSFTVAFWEKNTVPTGGSPQWLFSLVGKDSWAQSEFYAFFDHDGAGSTATNAVFKMQLRDQWLTFEGDHKMPGNLLNGEWHHMAITYDETTSKLSYYVDGQKLTNVPSGTTDVTKDGAPRGPMDFKDVYGFVIGGWNKHGGLGSGAPQDAWIQSWQGGLDQFRLYGKVLSDSEIQALYNSRQ